MSENKTQEKGVVDICIPTWNNVKQLADAINSLQKNTMSLRRVFIVNNGDDLGIKDFGVGVSILKSRKNLGWEGGVNLAAKQGRGEFILMCNDDVLFLPGQKDWLKKMTDILDHDKSVAAVGPSSNIVMGFQNIWNTGLTTRLVVPYLIGFCMLIRRDVFEKLGGLYEDLPGGDDLDLSIRIMDLGMKMVACRDSFVYHIGFQTGAKIHGGDDKPYGWNSEEMTLATNNELIRRHGVIKFHRMMYGVPTEYILPGMEVTEADKGFVGEAKGKGVDVGCGAKKRVESAVGVDIVPKGETITVGGQEGMKSVADVTSRADELPMFKDGEMDYVIASHVLEHILDPVKALREWRRILKDGGELYLSLPDAQLMTTIHLDPTHRHDFTIESISALLELVGFKVEKAGPNKDESFFSIKARKTQ